MKGQLAKTFLRTAGTALGSYLDDAFRLGVFVVLYLEKFGFIDGNAFFAPLLVG